MEKFKNLGIKLKLIIIFIVVKLIPLFLLIALAIKGIDELNLFVKNSNEDTLSASIDIIKRTASKTIEDSIEALDKKSQTALEIKTKDIANSIAEFLYQRDHDILYLSKLNNIDEETLSNFYYSKKKNTIIPKEFYYDDKTSKWIPKEEEIPTNSDLDARISDNKKYFSHISPKNYKTKPTLIYKEISLIDLNGNEILKASSIDTQLKNISKKENTYCKAETYFSDLQKLKEGEIFVSNVIGKYVGSKVIGSFTKEKAQKSNIEFEPEKYGYAGFENPLGKKFEGIIRFATPYYKYGKKMGYITLALDHTHIMEFTDYIIPTKEATSNYSDASRGNYAFMWDNEGRSISHPRDYFIVGYDDKTGKRVKPWLSVDLEEELKASGQPWEKFLDNYPIFHNQSLSKKLSKRQLIEEGNIALDCRYLNFAPQCSDWMNITKDGGYGSFVIFWSNVWKLTTVATIPYYTGKYSSSKRGFGYVTLGANLNEFHEATIKTKENIDEIIVELSKDMTQKFDKTYNDINSHVEKLVKEITISTIIMTIIIIFIAIWMANYITHSIKKLIYGTKMFKKRDFSYKIQVDTKDEIGQLATAFNEMSAEINSNMESLDTEVALKTKELTEKNIFLQEAKKIADLASWELDIDTKEIKYTSDLLAMIGLTQEEIKQNPKIIQELMSLEDWEKLNKHIKNSINTHSDFSFRYKIKRFDNHQILWMESRGKYIEGKNKLLGTAQNITASVEKEKKISSYVKLIDENIITSVTDIDGIITDVSSAFCKISGFTKEELVGHTHRIIRHPDMKESVFEDLWNTLLQNETWHGEFKNITKNGGYYWVEATISPNFNEDGTKVGYTAIRQDITEKKLIEELSITDGLTGIYNRRHFNAILPTFINSSKRNNDMICLFVMDVDHFKQYNDTYGHQKGDEVLIHIATSLQKSLIRADDMCFRLGGEEFGGIFKTNSCEKALEFTNTIKDNIEALQIEHKHNSASKYVTASFGLICKNSNDIEDEKILYKEADELLYHSKQHGRNKVEMNS